MKLKDQPLGPQRWVSFDHAVKVLTRWAKVRGKEIEVHPIFTRLLLHDWAILIIRVKRSQSRRPDDCQKVR